MGKPAPTPVTPKIQIGHPMIDEKVIEVPIGTLIRFVGEDGNVGIEIKVEHTPGEPLDINVRGCSTTFIGGKVYQESLILRAEATNSFYITNRLYQTQKGRLDV